MLQHFENLKSSQEPVRLKAVTTIVEQCQSSRTPEAKTTLEYAITRFVNGLRSPIASTRIEFYAGLTAVLAATERVDPTEKLSVIENALDTAGGDSKSEKKLLNIAKVLAYGSFVRAHCREKGKLKGEIAHKVLQSIVNVAIKKKNYLALATPFVICMINACQSDDLEDVVVNEVKRLLSKPDSQEDINSNSLKIMFVAYAKGATSVGTIPNVEELVKTLLAGIMDAEFLELLFDYINKESLFEAFWSIFATSLGPYHSELLCSCIVHSLKKGCRQNFILTKEIITLLLSIIKNKGLGRECQEKAIGALQASVIWSETCSLTSKERKTILKLLYKKSPNLLMEYQKVIKAIRSNLLCLTEKELEYLSEFLMKSLLSVNNESTREKISTLGLLGQIASQKNASQKIQVSICKLYFQLGFCKSSSEEVESDDVLKQHCASHYATTLQKNVQNEFVTEIFDFVSSIVEGAEGAHELLKPLDKQAKGYWDKALNFLKKCSNDVVSLVTRVGALQLFDDSGDIMPIFEEWLDVAKKSVKEGTTQGIIVFIVDHVTAMKKPFFHYEAIVRKFAMDGEVTEDVVQILADAIDISEEFEDEDDSEEDNDSDDDLDYEADIPTNGDSVINPKISFTDASDLANGNESDETIDMDEASEEDLRKMDEALAGVFGAKKQAKEAAKLEGTRHLRVLELIDILIRRFKEPPISSVLILLMPLISSVKQCTLQSVKSNQNEFNRTLKTLKGLNKFGKFSGMEEVDADLLSTLAAEIRELMVKKSVPKEVKNVLAASINNLLGKTKEEAKGNKVTKKKKKGKKGRNVNAPITPTPSEKTSTSTPQPPTATSEILDSKKSRKAQKKARLSSTEASEAAVPTKRKQSQGAGSVKKKAKLLRMQVLSEGLSNVE